jgi:hypothetical protein
MGTRTDDFASTTEGMTMTTEPTTAQLLLIVAERILTLVAVTASALVMIAVLIWAIAS